MIDPQEQWALQIDVTNACTRACSNCTRFVGHAEPFFMTVNCYRRAVEALADFPTDSPTTDRVKHKMVGMIGGEPLIHPEFRELVAVLRETIPNREHRGLWTGLRWQRTKYASLIQETFGYVNNNQHNTDCVHSPVLVSISDVIADPEERRRIIDNCWLQRMWSGTITPKGFFFCEVAGAMDLLFDGPGGLPVEPGCWRRPIADFGDQIERWCNRCGVPLNLQGRRDSEDVDDISQSNLDALRGSVRVRAGRYVPFSGGEETSEPWRYLL